MAVGQYNLQFEKLFDSLHLGKILCKPQAVSGGLLHRMFAVETTQGKFAVKALNPQIMARPTAMQNYINSERMAGIAAAVIPAVPAKVINGTFMQEMDHQYYLVFDWVQGRSLKPNEIEIAHCIRIGSILAEIHRTDFSRLGIANDFSSDETRIDWQFYLEKGQADNTAWAGLLYENMDALAHWEAQSICSAKLLSADVVISHRDMDSKNVLWHENQPIVIDWEAAGSINPMQELLVTALYWSENENGSIDKDRFTAFVNSYKKRVGPLSADWKTVLEYGFVGRLEWLEYSLKRSLRIECTDEEEQQLGTAQVTMTLNGIRQYAQLIPELESWLASS